MVQRRVTYRAELDGGAQVKAEFQGIGKAGRAAYSQIDSGQKSAEKSAKVFERALAAEERSFRALKASIDPAYAAQVRFERGQEQVNRAMRAGVISQKEASVALRQLEARSRGAATAMEMVDTATVGAGNGLRNSLLQVNQIGQQVAAGGNLMTAIAIQLPDILGGFGGIAPLIAGAAVGLAAGFIPKLFEAEEASSDLRADLLSTYQSAESALDAVREAQDRYTAAIELSGSAQSEITPQIIGSLALELRARQALAELDRLALEDRRAAANVALSDAQGRLDAMVRDATNASALAAQTAMQRGDEEILAIATERRRQQTQQVLAQNKDLVREIRAQGAELDYVNARLALGEEGAAILEAEMAAAADAAKRFGTNIDAADLSRHGAQAGLLAQQMGIAADEAARYNRALNDAAGLPGGTPASGGLSFGLPSVTTDLGGGTQARLGFGDLSKPALRRVIPMAQPDKARGGGGGGGAGQRAANQLDQEALRIRQATRTELERYNAEMANANKLLAAGALDQQTYNRHVAALKDGYQQATQGNQQFQQFVTSGKDAVIDATLRQKGAFDRLKASIERAAIEYAIFRTIGGQKVTGGLGGVFKSILGGLKSFDGGGHTGHGPRSGGLDGKGGFMAVMHPNERVTDLTRANGTSGRGSGQAQALVVGLGDGVQARWMRAAEARSMAQLGGFANTQRENYGAMLDQYQKRGTL